MPDERNNEANIFLPGLGATYPASDNWVLLAGIQNIHVGVKKLKSVFLLPKFHFLFEFVETLKFHHVSLLKLHLFSEVLVYGLGRCEN